MLTINDMVKVTPPEVKERAKKVRLLSFKIARTDGETVALSATTSTGKDKYETILVIYAPKITPAAIRNIPAWVSCSCDFFKFYSERALVKHGASGIIHTKDYDPSKKQTGRVVNPRKIPYVCKHLIRLMMEAPKVKVRKASLPSSLEMKLHMGEAERRSK